MAQVVELFGAPGAGKSSLARALDGRRVAGRRVVRAERLTRVARRGMRGLLGRRDLTPAERRAALAARREDWSALLSLAASAPATATDDPLRALQAQGWLTGTLEVRALADAAPDDVVVVIDEGFAQRAAVVCGSAPEDATLRGYLRVLPPPLLHVHVTAAPDTLSARLAGRGRIIDRHVGLDEAALRASLAADVALARRCGRELGTLGSSVLEIATDDGDLTADLTAAVLRAIGAALR